MWNIASTTLPQCCCYIEIMWVLQHWCTICYNIANGYFCATLRQTCSVSTKLYISATYPTNVADIKVQHCLHFAAAWIVYLGCSFFTPLISIENYQYCSNIVTNLTLCFTLVGAVCSIEITTLPQHCCYSDIIWALQHCYNIAYITLLQYCLWIFLCNTVATLQRVNQVTH